MDSQAVTMPSETKPTYPQTVKLPVGEEGDAKPNTIIVKPWKDPLPTQEQIQDEKEKSPSTGQPSTVSASNGSFEERN